MSNEQLQHFVTDELHWDPKVDSAAIAVSAEDGVVTLRGSVGSFHEKREAKQDAERVSGVTKVENELEVRLMDDDVRTDAEIRGSILQALMVNDLVPETVDAKVFGGSVTLTGTAQWQFQKDEAEHIAVSVKGVKGLYDEIALVPPPPKTGDVKKAIENAMERNARLDAKNVSVETENGTITLKGTVSSWADHDEAVSAAWAAPGVTGVKDHILVLY
jgi:osmotically-inducible protein OsmY